MLDFIAELTQHIPNKGEHLVRYFGWYSHRHRGTRAKLSDDSSSDGLRIDRSALEASSDSQVPRPGSVRTWAALIKRIFEVDPLECPQCGKQMKVISFIERRQQVVIERILRHCGLWEGPIRTLATERLGARPGRAARVAVGTRSGVSVSFLEPSVAFQDAC